MLPTNKDFIFRLKVSFILFILIGIFISYFKFSSTDKIVINEQGNVSGVLNKFRYKLQDKDFLIEQKKLVESKLDYRKKEPERLKELDETIKKIIDESNERMAELEKQYPRMKPSEIETYIDELRNRADRLEQLESRKILEEFRLEHISELELILNYLENMIKRD